MIISKGSLTPRNKVKGKLRDSLTKVFLFFITNRFKILFLIYKFYFTQTPITASGGDDLQLKTSRHRE